MKIIGREKEIGMLMDCYKSDKSELIGIFGRRRVGKTYLVRETFGNSLTFHVTGKYKGTKTEQLKLFTKSLQAMAPDDKIAQAKTWDDAFEVLKTILKKMPKIEGQKKVLFLDELPWLATTRSGMLEALEHFWNDFAAWEHDIVMIVCGSATAWMVEKIVDNHGGLHNRLTKRIHLAPFTLQETEAFLQYKGINWNRYQIAQCYMMMGGIPYYLDYIPTGGATPAMAIDQLFFTEHGVLREEYDNLFSSLYKNAKPHMAIVETLAKKNVGLTRSEIIKSTRLDDNGTLTTYLKNLISCGFVRAYAQYGNKKKEKLYQLVDPYTLFYLRFIQNDISLGREHWNLMIDNPAHKAWQGYAFEMLAMLHIEQIRYALGFGAVSCTLSSWRTEATDMYDGAQIDIVIDRRDKVINLCEVKFSNDEYAITSDYERNLRNKINAFRISTRTKSALHLTMITTYGIRQNAHSGIVTSQVCLDDFF